MLALLLDAVIQLQRRGTTSAEAAASWVRGDDGMTDASVLFRDFCVTLGLDPDHLAARHRGRRHASALLFIRRRVRFCALNFRATSLVSRVASCPRALSSRPLSSS